VGADNRNYNDGMGDMQGYKTMPNFKWFRLAIVSIIMIVSTIMLVFLGHFISPSPPSALASPPPSALASPPAEPPPIVSPYSEPPLPLNDPGQASFDYKLISSAHAGYSLAEAQTAHLKTLGVESYIWEITQPNGSLYVIQLGAYPTRSDCDSRLLQLKPSGITGRCWHPADGVAELTTPTPASSTYYKVILGAYPNYSAAIAATAGLSPYIWEKDGIYVAQVGAYSTADESRIAVKKLSSQGVFSYIWQERDGFDAIRNRTASTPPPKQNYHVVMGVFKTQDLAKRKADSVASITSYVIWANALGDKTVYRVLLGSYTTKQAAKAKQRDLNAMGIQSFVIFE
tara:strand:- start:600 stop:1628 length:1029 start_codon:yes stop_codon:yes gene_type:complete